MAEQTFKSPGFFEREIEVISRPLTRNTATPVGVIGPAKKGQAFVPKTVTSVDEFIKEFGMPDQDTSASHAISEFFSNGGKAATFCRILGTGKSSADPAAKHSYAGFKVEGTDIDNSQAKGAVQFIVASHLVNAAEHVTYGIFNDNDSITTASTDSPHTDITAGSNTDEIQLVRAMIFMHKDYTLKITNSNESISVATDDLATVTDDLAKLFNLYIHKTDGTDTDTYLVSLDPSSSNYISKVLNTSSYDFTEKKHFLYADFPVEDELASTQNKAVAVVRGKNDGSYLNTYGDFVARFSAPRTTSFISQPFGKKEYDLFHFESLDDGTYASEDYKLSITNLKASTQKNYKYGTFSVQLRKISDTDDAPVILESYTRCSLDPNAKNYVARLIGDQKVSLSLDVDSEDEKRLIREGTFPSKSSRIRIVMSKDVLRGEVPENSLPFGYRGIPALRTTDNGKDGATSAGESFLVGDDTGNVIDGTQGLDKIGFSVLPPLPFRSKVTKGSMRNSSQEYFQTYLGQAMSSGSKTSQENVKTSLYWGLKTLKVSAIDKPNDSLASAFNPLIKNLTKFLANSDAIKFSGSAADSFNNNKFSLAKVAFPGRSVDTITGSVFDAFLEAVYVRNADVGAANGIYDEANNTIDMNDTQDEFLGEDATPVAATSLVVGVEYEIVTIAGSDFTSAGAEANVVGTIFTATSTNAAAGTGTAKPARRIRATLAKLLSEDATKFNKYSLMAKFTAPFYGGFDGVNILNRDDAFFTDRSTSTDVGGHAVANGYVSGLAGTDDADPMQGKDLSNNGVMSYRNAIRIMTDEMIIDHNVLVIPGIRESLIADFAARRVKDYGKAIYLIDIPHYTKSNDRIFVSSTGFTSGVADVDLTSSTFNQREIDSSYVATYFPDVMIKNSGDDANARLTNHQVIRVPSSVVALGALAKSDSMSGSAPWFAPAGFSRGALDNVSSLDIRLNAEDRDTLYEARINPIANFPNNQFVIFGQKTTQIARTALDRVNVRRLMINIKRRIQKVAQRLLFEQNDAATRNRFISSTSKILADIRVGQGIEDFRVVMDDTNNTSEDIDNNRLNGRIVVVPTRAVEFIAMDFVITNSGVDFTA